VRSSCPTKALKLTPELLLPTPNPGDLVIKPRVRVKEVAKLVAKAPSKAGVDGEE